MSFPKPADLGDNIETSKIFLRSVLLVLWHEQVNLLATSYVPKYARTHHCNTLFQLDIVVCCRRL